MTSIIQIVLSLPIVLLALSVHETAHGFMAYKLGDNTAKSLGRLTLNPVKHFDLIGFLCMLFLRFGWAKPVPINSRYFKNPRRDMALTAAAGPVSNILLAFIFGGLLRLEFVFVNKFITESDILSVLSALGATSYSGTVAGVSYTYKIFAVLAFILYLGVILNISLAIFNLIPIPPFDGSRIFYVFLPTSLYFKVMKYERYIMMAILLLLFFTSFMSDILGNATSSLAGLVLRIFGFKSGGGSLYSQLLLMISYISNALI